MLFTAICRREMNGQCMRIMEMETACRLVISTLMFPEMVRRPNCTCLVKTLEFKGVRLLTSAPKSLISMLPPARFRPNVDSEI